MGERGPRGEHGTRGEPGASMHPIVARIDRIEHELELQRTRMAQIERQLDDLRSSPGGVTASPTDPRPPTTGRLATILARAAARDVK